ncbi:MAG: hypothetical protein JSW39_02130 [Desulfobacterales bacterium]|nr:MAG: hypothetical protein JSW39_02130 [Desulfobacterales bacterium]
MSFKENLLRKIQIDELTHRILNSIGPPESGRKVDKDTVRRLLEMSPYVLQKERDLELYIRKIDTDRPRILVLDNELPIYRTTVEDVVMRKSPFIKEMANIRNIIKILKDSDVKISRKEDSVKAVRQECIEQLDLSFNETDLDEIRIDGAASLESGYGEGVIENLTLLAELLGYQSAPKAFQIRHSFILGELTREEGGAELYGPIVIYDRIQNELMLIDGQVNSRDEGQKARFHRIATGAEKATLQGAEVFRYLKEAAVHRKLSNP